MNLNGPEAVPKPKKQSLVAELNDWANRAATETAPGDLKEEQAIHMKMIPLLRKLEEIDPEGEFAQMGEIERMGWALNKITEARQKAELNRYTERTQNEEAHMVMTYKTILRENKDRSAVRLEELQKSMSEWITKIAKESDPGSAKEKQGVEVNAVFVLEDIFKLIKKEADYEDLKRKVYFALTKYRRSIHGKDNPPDYEYRSGDFW